MKLVFIFLQPLLPIGLAITVLEKTCQTFPYSFYHGHSCFIASSAKKTFSQAKAECATAKPKLPIGHLAYILTQETLNAVVKAKAEGKVLEVFSYIGLEQIPNNDESDGGKNGWTWTHSSLPNRPTPHHDLLLWRVSPEPDPHAQASTDDVATVSEVGLLDVSETVAFHYLCEHEEPTFRMYHRCHKNKMGHNTTMIAQYNSLSRIECGEACASDLMCRSFSFNQGTSHCLIHWTDGGVTNFEPIDKNGYNFFISHYSYNKKLYGFPICV